MSSPFFDETSLLASVRSVAKDSAITTDNTLITKAAKISVAILTQDFGFRRIMAQDTLKFAGLSKKPGA